MTRVKERKENPDKQEPAREPDGRWKKGVSGNPEGRKGPTLTPILRRALNELHETGDKSRAEALIEIGIEAAMSGNYQYWKEIFDRIDGKVIERAMLGIHETEVDLEWPD